MPKNVFNPKSIEDLKDVVVQARGNGSKITQVQSNVSRPARTLAENEFLVSLGFLTKIIDIDSVGMRVKVEPSVKIDKLINILKDNKMELPGVSIVNSDDIVSDLVVTPFHGTGSNRPILASYITEVTLLLSSGAVEKYSRKENPDIFPAVLLSLGCFGIILSVEFQVEALKTYRHVKYSLKLNDVLVSLDSYIDSSEYFNMSWFPYTESVIIYNASQSAVPKLLKIPVKNRISWFKETLLDYHFVKLAIWLSSLIPSIIPTVNKLVYKLYSQRRVFVHEGLTTINPLNKFKYNVLQYSIPKKEAVYFLIQIQKLLENNKHVCAQFGVEVSYSKGDDLWLSPSYSQDSCYLKILVFKSYGKICLKWLQIINDLVTECIGRPALSNIGLDPCMKISQLNEAYAKLDDFNKIRKDIDPQNIFLASDLNKIFF